MTIPQDLHPKGCTLTLATPAEADFLRRLFVEIETAAMPVALPPLIQMLDQQHDSRMATYRQSFPQATDLIIRRNGTAIGRLMIDLTRRPIHGVDIAILPDWQSKGIGTAVLQAMCNTARAYGTDVSISVIEGQPAQRLYSRMGFEVTGRTPPHATMLWSGPAA
ncbi:GNAT family N-acetyltransferase [uncultured Tateyamaria sp.]|uniref:GNAT family N-acetyltransferase n=1 Tax=uncultured Tateyamaria sp. TaxID=455651 RepID=UPI00262F6606|nr:GNAT family N-acetyltransferase [uncultured Tateyamaria sp.]